MSDAFAATFEQINQILGICPCCGDIFRLADTRPYLKGRRPQSMVDDLQAAERRIDQAEQRLAEREQLLREAARNSGLKSAKRQLRKIDPVFSGRGIDPQDVKVIFDPVEYVVFRGLSASKVTRIMFLTSPPQTSAEERLHKSLVSAIRGGNLSFHTLRVLPDGHVEAS